MKNPDISTSQFAALLAPAPFRRSTARATMLVLVLGASLVAMGSPRSPAAAQSAGEIAPPWSQVGGAMNAAVHHGELLWLAVGPRVIALDLARPGAPPVVASSPVLPGVVNDLEIDVLRSRLWAAAGDALLAIDIGETQQPRVAATIELGEAASRVAIDGGRVWAMDSDGGIHGIDASVVGDHQPSVRIPAPQGQRVADLAAGQGELLRLGLRASPEDAPVHLDRWSVASPDIPRPLPSIDLPGANAYLFGHEQLLWQEDQLWVQHEQGLTSFTFATDGPAFASHDDLGWGGFPVGIALRGDRAYASFASGWSDNYGVGVFDLSDPNDIRPLTNASWTIGRFPGVFSRAATLVDDRFWVASSGGFLTGLLVGPETFMRLAGTFATVGEATALDHVDGHLIATSNQSVQFVGTTEPLQPTHGALISAGFHYGNVDVSGELVGVAVRGQSDMLGSSLHVHRRSAPHTYERVAELRSPIPGGYSNAVALEEATLVYADWSSSGGVLTVYDLSEASTPSQETRSALRGRATALSLEEGILLALELDGPALRLLRHRLEGFALEDQSTQALRGGLASWADTWLARSGERVVVLASDRDPDAPASGPRYRQHLFVLDLPPEGPMTLRSSTNLGCPAGGRASDIALDGEHLLVACLGDAPGVAILDLGDPDAPRLARHMRTPFGSTGVAVADGHLYLAAGPAGVLVYREPPGGWGSESVSPTTETPFPTPTTAPATPTQTATAPITASPTPSATATPSRSPLWLPWTRR
jgi:hypothetical protein